MHFFIDSVCPPSSPVIDGAAVLGDRSCVNAGHHHLGRSVADHTLGMGFAIYGYMLTISVG